MCTEHVAKFVRERIQREGRPTVSRRNFLRLGGVATAATVLASQFAASPVRAQDGMQQVIDLSHIFNVNPPTYVPGVVPTREDFVTVANDGFFIQNWTFSEHTGTHIDIPAHFIGDGETVDHYPANLYVSPAVVIDIAAKAEENPDSELTIDDITAWESANGEIPQHALVCMYSGWDTRWDSVEDFRNADDDGVMHFPGFNGEAAAFLMEERDIHGIAVDTLSLDNGPSATFDTHFTVLGAGKYGLENIANLGEIKDSQATIVIGVPRWEGGSGGPCRVLALV